MGQEQATLKDIVERSKEKFEEDVFVSGCVLTADTGFCSEDNLAYLYENQINAVIPNNQIRLRDSLIRNLKRAVVPT